MQWVWHVRQAAGITQNAFTPTLGLACSRFFLTIPLTRLGIAETIFVFVAATGLALSLHAVLNLTPAQIPWPLPKFVPLTVAVDTQLDVGTLICHHALNSVRGQAAHIVLIVSAKALAVASHAVPVF